MSSSLPMTITRLRLGQGAQLQSAAVAGECKDASQHSNNRHDIRHRPFH